ncbi:urease accessory protein UreF [Streptomyces sp. PU-14G]|uniref:urease accessory protein UreF n=1 Tax=Streptomyces sp. PU-14G TaxID=2800808 RepID=UPI0034DF84CA
MSAQAALLLFADGRLPAGGYAHSGGLEESVRAGRVGDAESLESFLEGRARTVGLVSAAFAARSCQAARGLDPLPELEVLDAELDARTPSPAQRETSRQLGRQLHRLLTGMAQGKPQYPLLERLPSAPHQPLVLGTACAAFGLRPLDAALVALHESVTGPAVAAVRLMSIDPFRTHAALARIAPSLDRLARHAVQHCGGEPRDMPAAAAPLLDIAAEAHATRSERLFAS